MRKRLLLAGVGTTALVAVGFIGFALMPMPVKSETEPPYITDIRNTLDSHQAQITQNTNDIGALQEKTGTAPTKSTSSETPEPSSSATIPVVMQATTPVPAPTAIPTPTVVSYSVDTDIACDGTVSRKYYLYWSDGSETASNTAPDSGRFDSGHTNSCSNSQLH